MAKYRTAISHERLCSLLSYDKETGEWIWLTHRRGQSKPGSVAGQLGSDGYIKIRVDGLSYQSHRLAWFYVNAVWPQHEIDHCDLNKSNNKWVNLREATHQENMINVGAKRRKLPYAGQLKGVYPTENGTWISQIRVNGKARRLGTFNSKEEAYASYCAASANLHGEFARIA